MRKLFKRRFWKVGERSEITLFPDCIGFVIGYDFDGCISIGLGFIYFDIYITKI